MGDADRRRRGDCWSSGLRHPPVPRESGCRLAGRSTDYPVRATQAGWRRLHPAEWLRQRRCRSSMGPTQAMIRRAACPRTWSISKLTARLCQISRQRVATSRLRQRRSLRSKRCSFETSVGEETPTEAAPEPEIAEPVTADDSRGRGRGGSRRCLRHRGDRGSRCRHGEARGTG